jgi:tetratricopeptide (TPR) repeat protein
MYTRTQHYIAILLYLIAAILLIRQPVFGNLGFEYAAAVAVIASLIAGLRAVRDERRRGDVPPAVRYRDGLWINVGYLLIPLLVIFIASLPRLPCDPVEGLAFYGLLPVVSVIFAYTLGWLVSLLFRWGRAAYILIFVFSFLLSGFIAFIQPRIYFYNPFIGFFPGLSYDELMPITSTLIMYRGYTLFLTLFMGLIIYMLRFTPLREARLRDRPRLFLHSYSKSFLSIPITICLIVILVQYLSRGPLGFSTPRGYLENSLGEKFETRSMKIYYPAERFDENEIKWVALEHEFQRHRAMNRLGVMQTRRIRSYLYPDPETKRALAGPATTNIAQPWSREIHSNADGYERSLYHELVHVVAGNFGMPVARISNSMAMVEGLAMAAEGRWGNRTLHEHAAAIIQFEIVGDPGALLDNRGFAAKHSAVSYVMSGSFIQYLIDRYGIHRVRNAYAWTDYEGAFDRSREQLVREWTGFLRDINVSERQRLKTRIHFQRPPLFAVRCPRALARLNRSAREHLAGRRYADAERLFRQSWETAENAAALGGLVQAWYYTGEFDRILELLDDTATLDRFPSVIPVLYRAAGDIHAVTGDSDRAERLYRRLLAIDHSDHVNEASWLRLFAVGDPGDTDLWRLLYYEREERNEILAMLSDEILEQASTGLHWMIARYLHDRRDFTRSVVSHRTLRDRTEEPFLRYIASLRIGEALFYSGRFQEAKTEFWEAMNYADTPAAVSVLDEWIDRVDYTVEFGSQIWNQSPPWN